MTVILTHANSTTPLQGSEDAAQHPHALQVPVFGHTSVSCTGMYVDEDSSLHHNLEKCKRVKNF